MLMISEVLSYDKQQLKALSLIDPVNPLLQQGRFPGYAALELVAQASGLFLGLNMDGDGTTPGAIVSIRDLDIFKVWLAIDDVMHIKTIFLGGSEQAAMFQGSVYQSDKLVFKSTLIVSRFNKE
ncbi:MAG: hypothetical protein Q9M11_08530 [Mariprofundaceae bacterium]|nr:hypothetical protein [Mariprofundaceae bacterium]